MKSKTKLYTPIISGIPVNMISLSGLTEDQAAKCCISIFGKRFQGFNK